jgi:hypothetical protein
MTLRRAQLPRGSGHETHKVRVVQSRAAGPRTSRHAIVALAAVTLGIVLAGAFAAVRIVSGSADAGATTHFADGRVPTSFGALWVDSFREIAVPEIAHQGHVGIPQTGRPDKVALEVRIRLANTTAAPVELTPARFALRLAHDGTPISVDGASFESVRLVPGAIFDARIQFPVRGGEHQLSLLFDDPGGSGPIAIDLGQARFQHSTDDDHDDHD